MHLDYLKFANMFKVKFFQSFCRINRRTFATAKGSTAKSKTSSLTRSDVVANIAKNFKNVDLTKFPITKLNDLSKYKKIQKANNNCSKANLDDDLNYYPSISTILNQTMSPESLATLKRWESEKIKQLGYDGFLQYKKGLFSRGRVLHNNIQTYLKTRDTSKLQFDSGPQENFWKSIEHIMPKINTLYAAELPVHHPHLKYRGILDCVATYYDIPTIFEWKTSEKLKPTIAHTFDNPLQTVAYYSCLQYDQPNQNNIPKIEEAILVIAYEDGSKANVHILESSFRENAWKQFLMRLEQYWSQLSQ